MSLQISFLQEFKLLLVLTMFIFGLQISILFIYKYFKLKDENVKLNRVLLSYGFLVLMAMLGMLFFSLVTLFVPDPGSAELYRKLAYLSGIVAFLFFWLYVSNKEFSHVLTLKITRLFLFLTIIPIFLVVFLSSESQEFRYSLIILIAEALFLVIFQINLIRRSVGTVKKRFIQIFIAALFMVISIGLGANSAFSILPVPKEIYDLTFFLGFIFMMIGLSILYFALHNFPPILEFKWKDNLFKLVIFNQRNYSCLYLFDFPQMGIKKVSENDKRESLSLKDSTELLSGGLTGINSIISAITNTQNEKIKKIKQGNSYILLEYSLKYQQIPITFALLVKEDLKSIRFFLSTIKVQFELFYKDILTKLDELGGNVEKFFSSFEVIIKNILERT